MIKESCAIECKLYQHCSTIANSEVEQELLDRNITDLMLGSIENNNNAQDTVLADENLEGWIERMTEKFADDPEGLRRALEAMTPIVDQRIQNADDTIRMGLAHETALRAHIDRQTAEVTAARSFMEDLNADGCDGPETVRVGFLKFKKAIACRALTDDTLKSVITGHVRARAVYLENPRNLPGVDNGYRYDIGEYDNEG